MAGLLRVGRSRPGPLAEGDDRGEEPGQRQPHAEHRGRQLRRRAPIRRRRRSRLRASGSAHHSTIVIAPASEPARAANQRGPPGSARRASSQAARRWRRPTATPPARDAAGRRCGRPTRDRSARRWRVAPSAVLPRAMSSTAPWPSSSDGGVLTLRSCTSDGDRREADGGGVDRRRAEGQAGPQRRRRSRATPKARAADRRCAPEHQAAIPASAQAAPSACGASCGWPARCQCSGATTPRAAASPAASRPAAAATRSARVRAADGSAGNPGSMSEPADSRRQETDAGVAEARAAADAPGRRQLQHELDAAVRCLRRHLHPAFGALGQIAGGRDPAASAAASSTRPPAVSRLVLTRPAMTPRTSAAAASAPSSSDTAAAPSRFMPAAMPGGGGDVGAQRDGEDLGRLAQVDRQRRDDHPRHRPWLDLEGVLHLQPQHHAEDLPGGRRHQAAQRRMRGEHRRPPSAVAAGDRGELPAELIGKRRPEHHGVGLLRDGGVALRQDRDDAGTGELAGGAQLSHQERGAEQAQLAADQHDPGTGLDRALQRRDPGLAPGARHAAIRGPSPPAAGTRRCRRRPAPASDRPHPAPSLARATRSTTIFSRSATLSACSGLSR